MFSYYKSMEANDHPGRGQLGPQGHDWQDLIYKYIGFRPCGFREEDFFHIFPIITLCYIMMPPGRGQFEPQGHGWQDL